MKIEKKKERKNKTEEDKIKNEKTKKNPPGDRANRNTSS